MAGRKNCVKCGYSTTEKDSTCPICGGHMSGFSFGDSCDTEYEKEWNSGSHNDFAEGRKTGEYCDESLEKNINGGEHYHGSEKQTYTSQLPIGDEAVSDKILLILQFIFSLFPLVGCITAYAYIVNKPDIDSDFKKKLILVTIAGITLRYMFMLGFAFNS